MTAPKTIRDRKLEEIAALRLNAETEKAHNNFEAAFVLLERADNLEAELEEMGGVE